MNRKEVSDIYRVPIEELIVLEQAGLLDEVINNDGERDYQNQDIQKLSHILSFRKIGLEMHTIVQYITLEKQGKQTVCERKRILKAQRQRLLAEIHTREKSIDCIDYLLFEMCGCECGE